MLSVCPYTYIKELLKQNVITNMLLQQEPFNVIAFGLTETYLTDTKLAGT
jgi:hypothetical protein